MSTTTGRPDDPGTDPGRAGEAKWRKTACILCECNCGVEVQVRDRSLVRIRGDKEHPESGGYTCEKALHLDRYQNGRHRLTSPMRRRPDGGYEEIDWDTALDEVAARLAAVRDTHGGDRIFFYAGGGQGNHLGGIFGRSLHRALGGRYYSNALAQEKTGEAWVDHLMQGHHTCGDFDRCEVAVFIGKNPWQTHGVPRARPVLREIGRDPGRAVIVVDPRLSETAKLADFHLRVAPGTDAWCMSALAAVLVQEDLVAHRWLDEHVTGVDAVLDALRAVDVADHARRCDVDEDLIRGAARRIASAESVATYEDLGVQHSPNSTLVSYLNKMLWLLTGSYAKPGGMHQHSWMVPIAHPLRAVPSEDRPVAERLRRAVGRPVMRHGAALMRRALAAAARFAPTRAIADRIAGLALHVLFRSVAVPIVEGVVDRLNYIDAGDRTPVSGQRILYGLIPSAAITDEILTDHPSRLRALVIDSSNPVTSLPESDRFVRAMREVDVSVVVDVAFTETARHADYVLPAASQFEKYEATFFTFHFPHNTFQLRRPVLDPMPGTRSEPEIYCALTDRVNGVDQRVLDDLAAAARSGHRAYGVAFCSTLEQRPELGAVIAYLLYRTLGATLPESDRILSVVWGMAQICAVGHPDGVARAGFGPPGFDQGERLYAALRDRHEGLVFTVDRYPDAWKYVYHDDGRIHAEIPVLLDELARICSAEPGFTSAEFPFVLATGERRSFTANTIIRDPGWRRRDAEGALRIGVGDAGRLGVENGDRVRVVTASGTAEAPVEVTDTLRDGHVTLPNGMGVTYPDTTRDGSGPAVGVAINDLTAADRRDPFLGTPWYKNVPARIEVLG